jgi:hypothetical protein
MRFSILSFRSNRLVLLLLSLCGATSLATAQRFAAANVFSTGSSSEPSRVAVGDLNQDGVLDIASTYSTGVGSAPQDLALGDVNQDGRLDILTANTNTHTLGVLLGQATNGFAPVSVYPTGVNSYPSRVALGDVNGDGQLDLVTTNLNANTALVLLGQGNGGFAAAISYPTGSNSRPAHLALGDLNTDVRLDIVFSSSTLNAVGVLLGRSGGFAPASNYLLAANSQPEEVTLGDVNGDGRLDVVAVSYFTNSVKVLLGQASGGLAGSSSYWTGPSSYPRGVATGDVNGDGQLDIVTANFSSTMVAVLLGQASGFNAPTTYFTGTGSTPYAVALGDMNGDGRIDIIAANPNTGTVGVLLNTDTFPLATAQQHALTASVQLSPNPTRAGFAVQWSADVALEQAELLNTIGQAVRQVAVTHRQAKDRLWVDTQGLAAGIYMLRLQVDGVAIVRRVVLE